MDSILYWNEVALEANRVSHTNGANEQTGPTLSSRALGIVHLAMHDAFAGASNLPDLYLAGLITPPAAKSASPRAAVAAAAHATLSALFPSQKLFFDSKRLLAPQDSPVTAPQIQAGSAFGLAVAQAILKDRKDKEKDLPKGKDNNLATDEGYTPSTARGSHRPDPDNPDQGFHGPFYGMARLFAASQRHGLSSPPPPEFKNQEYAAALTQVRGKGIAPELMGTLPPNHATWRTPEETLIGLFWGYDGSAGLGTPPRLYNQIVRKVSEAKNSTEAENARLFAFVNAAMADAGILAWEQKYKWDFWRPVVAIREEDSSMGPASAGFTGLPGGETYAQDGDPGWLPLGAPSTNVLSKDVSLTMGQFPSQQATTLRVKNFTPNFPAYPSGHATFGAAALHITRLFYGQKDNSIKAGDRKADKLFDGLTFVSDEFNGQNRDNRGAVRPRHVRKFKGGLWDMIVENGLSRVFLGVHWVFDAFRVDPKDGKTPVLDGKDKIGGVQLGLDTAEDIFKAGGGKAPKRSTA